ncbi:NAD(P)/FAD-dependent oxidoreductase [Cetobacterium sp.]|uniref:NAD(P)/FAD-dependent oxidoreductase n=1 Tax=Cetobacterium sp. TaxID=2071632 RepID=UPI002FC9036E
MKSKKFDLIIIGAGPAGLAAAIYAGRANLNVLVIKKEGVGSLLMAHKIDNYPGFPEGITGKELYDKMKEQALKYKVKFEKATLLGIDVVENVKIVKTDLENFMATTVIVASGWAKNNASKIKGEDEFLGKGVSYCANCDGAFTKNMTVGVFGKGEEAIEEALFLTRYAKDVILFTSDDKSIDVDSKIKVVLNAKLEEIKGKEYVESVDINEDGEIKNYNLDYTFLYLGTKNMTELYRDVATLNTQGYLLTDDRMKTNVEGVFAAGDIREKVTRQVTTAVSDGTIAAIEAIKYITQNRM